MKIKESGRRREYGRRAERGKQKWKLKKYRIRTETYKGEIDNGVVEGLELGGGGCCCLLQPNALDKVRRRCPYQYPLTPQNCSLPDGEETREQNRYRE
jgi:hypothetical protein